MTPTQFLDELSSISLPSVFNPYSDVCKDSDVENAALIRRRNLQFVLNAAIENSVDTIWVARDLGYRGGRRTGLALTDEGHLEAHSSLYGGLPLRRSTKGPPIVERTASVVWNMLSRIGKPVFLWNVFPLHPHADGDASSNRCHTGSEALICQYFLQWIIATLQPARLIAIGQEAHSSLNLLDISHVKVRHPSYGGKREFEEAIVNLYQIEPSLKESYAEAQTSLYL